MAVLHLDSFYNQKQHLVKLDAVNFNLVRLAGVEPARAYAHYPLKVACLPFHHNRICSLKKNGASGQNRTVDTRIFSPLLYRLSYRGKIS